MPSPALSSAEEIINEARNGRMFILVDDEDRENEGDLIVPAQMATPDAINFMATCGRGLICLALTKARADQLNLDPMATSNGTRHETAFTVSIEARQGVSTGISAGDRARTIAVAIDAAHGPEDVVSPGHIFPLVARPGGVLVRAGHTEAAVDVARLAGLNASGVICEIMNEDGTMARLDDLIAFSQRHALKLGTIRDLIAYRRRHDRTVVKAAETEFLSHFGGQWRMMSFRNDAVGSQTIALVKGDIKPDRPTLVRMHQLDLFSDTLGEIGDRTGLLQSAMQTIEREGNGVVVVINRSFGDLGGAIAERQRQIRGETSDPGELRDYGTGAQVLTELGIHDIILLSTTPHSPVALAGYGLTIVEERPLKGFVPHLVTGRHP
ncbi:3,4-dihydroxy-2-butanone-4-phosphate synthase [Sphingomonas populi]|uniref:3,4-dihydroxy-2-butanone 4-phosphate synthase n=2 Tax=Sphingomonas populi TaxID=2484750 RepID=A0A4Q6Y2I2_9SPHN|nr:3,4-dihydroxy-2-butanone-4-phosphate synthase [Sphingomonas populi]